jgi:ABC-type tungstate transport system substrate-binding protein
VIHYHLYWGFVSYDDALDPTSTFLIFAAGPAMSTLLGLAAFALALRVRNFARIVFWTFGSATLLIVLLVYPIFSFIGPVGDFQGIYSLATPRLSLLAAVVHLSAAVVALRLNRRIEKLAAADLRRPSRHPPLSISTEMERGRG